MKKKYYVLYMAYTIWKMHDEINKHLEISSKNKEEWNKHFNIHLCNIDTMEILMKVIKTWFPEIYQEKGKSIQSHFDEAQVILEKNLFGKKYKKLV